MCRGCGTYPAAYSAGEQGSLWLIDFAKACVCGLFTDAVKVVGVLLLEHYPLPLTLGEVRAASVQKLVDALQACPPLRPERRCLRMLGCVPSPHVLAYFGLSRGLEPAIAR